MKTTRCNVPRRRLLGAALMIAPVVGAAPWRHALAAEYPGSRPIKLIVPFPPGGGTDSAGRWIAQGLAQELKGTVIVENVPSATGTLGTARVASAANRGSGVA